MKNSISQKSAAGKASAQARKAKKGANTQQNSNERSTGVNAPFEQNSNGNSTNKDTDTDTDTDLKEKEERELSAQESFLPPIGKFPITDDWMPSDDFVGQAAQWGINLGDRPGYTPVELQQFRDYWKCEGKVKHHLQWEQTFASSLKTSRAKTSTSG
ncbi:DnaT-like ssDNA-binding domain-containing protein, partial [Enterobacter hormaechei]|uniref:DnaT-like ssDNA-binding domain-containing protein n=1 Tax=Enterobacter hormaechei TaxID=158836 RepID=UPI0023E3DBD4